MYEIFRILSKEFRQIFRNRTMLPVIFVLPIVQLLVLVYAATMEMKEINMVVVDLDISERSRELTAKFDNSPFYNTTTSLSLNEAEDLIKENEADCILFLPSGFEKELYRTGESDLQLLINGINGTAAGLIENYSRNIIGSFNKDLIFQTGIINPRAGMPGIETNISFWYNENLDYKIYMVPGILVILVTIVGMFLTAFNIVREKEMGTIEQINVTPIKKYQFIFGKLFPFWIIAMFELAFGILLGKLIFGLPILGSLGVLFGFAAIYLLLALGIGLFLSTISQTQQQVLFIAFFFVLVFILMSGIFTPAESMPDWAQRINIINPFAYFMRVIRMILLKGSGAADLAREFISMSVYAVIMISLAVFNYRKRGA